MNGILLEGEVLGRCAMSAGRAAQQGAGDLLSDAEGSVASEAAMPIVDLFSVR
jgi:hypothetical protein